MRPHGSAKVNAASPRAWAICDRCGFLYNHDVLAWQFEWFGPRMQNRRILVCPMCLDKPQEQTRTIVLPADPQPINNPRTEDYRGANDGSGSGIAGLGWDPANLRAIRPLNTGAMIGSTNIQGGNPSAAFDGNLNKPMKQCVYWFPATVGLQNWVGRFWSGAPSGAEAFQPQLNQTYTATSYTITPPNDRPFFGGTAIEYEFQGSQNGISWSRLFADTTSGAAIIQDTLPGTAYAYHRVVFNGDSVQPVGIAQLQISVLEWPSAEI